MPTLAALSLLGLPSLSSAQMLGIIPQKRPRATGDIYRDYDWTGLTLTWAWQLPYVSGWFLAGADCYYYGGNYAHNVYSYDVFGNGWENSATRLDLTGTSTYKWKWVPPNIDYIIHGGDKVFFRTDINYTNPQDVHVGVTGNGITDLFAPITNNNGFAGYVYSGLPASNDALGNHKVYFQVKTGGYPRPITTTVSETAHIQTFFPGLATTHPVNNPNDIGIPNWLYYYRQVYQPNSAWVYDPAAKDNRSFYDPNVDVIHIANSADLAMTDFHVFALPPGEQYVKWVGDLQIKGLYRFIRTVAHEQGHRNDGMLGIERGLPDGDGDGISDTWEINHHFKTNERDTTGAYGGDPNADRECLCDIQALGVLIATWNNGSLSNDWADNGALFGRLRWPAGQAQWTFIPRDDMGNMGAPTNIIPDNVLVALP